MVERRLRGGAVLTSLVVCAVVLAGCTGKSAPVQSARGDEAAQSPLDVKATATTGVIRGVVVDETVRPVPGVAVVALSAGTEVGTTRTNVDGAFGFQGLQPGAYVLMASKPGYFDLQQAAIVNAGVDKPPMVKLSLAANPQTAVYHGEYSFEGLIECSTTTVVIGLAVCSAPNVILSGVCAETGTCVGNVTNDRFLVDYKLDRVPTWVQSEMVWESTQALGGEMSLLHSQFDAKNNNTERTDFSRAEGASPLLVTTNATLAQSVGLGNGTTLTVRVFNSDVKSTRLPVCPPETPVTNAFCIWGLGATIEQSFTVYTHVFYGYQPPEGWRFTVDGTVPAPPE